LLSCTFDRGKPKILYGTGNHTLWILEELDEATLEAIRDDYLHSPQSIHILLWKASETVIGETQWVMEIKDDAWVMVQGLRTSNTAGNAIMSRRGR
jgi:hypothetical protein